MSSFTQPLHVTYIGNSLWRVTKPFEYHVGREGSGDIVFVPESYITDLASIPWFARWLVDRNGNHNQPAVGHDILYTIGRIRKFVQRQGGRIDDRDYVRFSVNGPKVFLRNYPYRSRKECDRIFLEMMEVVDASPYPTRIPAWQRKIMYRAVRVGGGWNMNPKAVFKRVQSYSIAALKQSTTHS